MEKKLLLSVKDLIVKFRVRGRTLTAIRGISLDIYENESIAIVGESGSGKSVFTKTFAGMLDENGYIDQGSIRFFDDTLSDTTIPYAAREKRKIRKYAEKLNRASVYESASDLYREMEALKTEKKERGRLSESDYQAFRKKIDAISYQKTEAYNQRLTLDSKKQKEEIRKADETYKKLEAELKQTEKELEKAKKEKAAALKADKEYLTKWKERYDEKKKQYDERVQNAVVSDELKERNEILAREIVLSVDRFPFMRREKSSHALLKALKRGMKEGADLYDPKELDRLYGDITFRVEYRDTVGDWTSSPQIFSGTIDKFENGISKEDRARLLELGNALIDDESAEAVRKAVKGSKSDEKLLALAEEISSVADRFPRKYYRKNLPVVTDAIVEAANKGEDLSDQSVRGGIYRNCKCQTDLHGYAGIDLAKVKYSGDWMQVRGERIATVFQDPMTSLNPIITIGKQITSVIIRHQHCSEAEARKRALILMKKVGIPNAEKRFDDYPFQYSGGMRQRIVIAIALSCQPKILICDEPTTALDVTIQAQILKLIKELQKEFGYTIVFITHDLGVVANIADRVAVLYAGQVVELGKVEEVFYDPKHPYTWALLSSLPQLAERNTKLFSIQGTPPSLYNKIIGDPFAPRNQYCMKIDTLKEPPYYAVSDTHIAKTWLLDPRSPKVEKPALIQDIHEKLMRTYHITEGEQ